MSGFLFHRAAIRTGKKTMVNIELNLIKAPPKRKVPPETLTAFPHY